MEFKDERVQQFVRLFRAPWQTSAVLRHQSEALALASPDGIVVRSVSA
jgi:hypothetical protein